MLLLAEKPKLMTFLIQSVKIVLIFSSEDLLQIQRKMHVRHRNRKYGRYEEIKKRKDFNPRKIDKNSQKVPQL